VRFLVDESCDRLILQLLKEGGYDVVAVSDLVPRADDAKVFRLAVRDQRILVTEDKDFGQLVFAGLAGKGTVIFLRYPWSVRLQIGKTLLDWLAKNGEKQLSGTFIVVQPGKIRTSHLA